MMKKMLLLCSVIGMLAAVSGCGLFEPMLYEPFGPGTACDPTHCGPMCCGPGCCGLGCCGLGWCGPRCYQECCPPCEMECGPACEADCCPECDPICDTCDAECAPDCDPCYEPCGPPCYAPCGPLSWLMAIFRLGCCDYGCGERYWGDFHGNPPDCCDPCDRMGNFTGGACCTGEDCCIEEDPSGWVDASPPRPYVSSPRVVSQGGRVARHAKSIPSYQSARPRRVPSRQY